MQARLHVLTGGRAGAVAELTRSATIVGRHPDSDVPLDPQSDLLVSSRHAEILQRAGRWVLRDLGSRNGTFINGRRISEEQELRNGDRIAFGLGGPAAEFRLASAPPEALRAGPRTDGAEPRPIPEFGVTTRIRIEVGRRTRRWRQLSAALVVLMAGVAAAFLYVGRKQRASWDQERAALEARIDSVLASSDEALRSLEDERAELAAALRASQASVRERRAQLQRAGARGDRPGVAALERQLHAATVALRRQQLAASLDFRAIENANRAAVAVVYVEFENGEVTTATAFAVRSDGLLLTCRHVVAGPDGTLRPRRVGVQFAGSRQVWPTRVVARSSGADLALLQADNILGDVPVVRGLNQRPDTLIAGAPVALIGFPLAGLDAVDKGGRASLVQPLLTAGVVSAALPGRLEVQGYGAPGASGSPVLDSNGEVVGVLFAGRESAGGSVLLVQPISAASSLLAHGR